MFKAFAKFLYSSKSASSTGLKLERPSSESLPYACHYSPDTILTKNGELLQIIKLEDFHSEQTVRDALRSSINEHIDGDNFAITIHTVRLKKSTIIPWNDKNQEAFPYKLHQSRHKHGRSQIDYKTDIYISIVSRGYKKNNNILGIILQFLFSHTRKECKRHIKGQHDKLSNTTNQIAADLQQFNAQKLGLDDTNNSQLFLFLRSIITLLADTGKIPLPKQDVSEYLLNNYTNAFGFNSFEISSHGKKKFSTILGVKRYREVDIEHLSMAMHLNMEFIITETIDFDLNTKQLKKVNHQNYLFDINGEQKLHDITGLSQFTKQPKKYINHNINITPIATSIAELENSVSSIIASLAECGMGLFRHDISLENAFLSMLPGNFSKTLSHFSTIHNIAGFALFNAIHSGIITCTQWEYPITLFWSTRDTPYFFKFHNNGIGHSTIIGPVHSGKTMLQNFIISESKKFSTKVVIIDQALKSQIFIRALNGHYQTLDTNHLNISYNPFQIENSAINTKFLHTLIYMISDQEHGKALVSEVCNSILALPLEERTLENIKEIISPLRTGTNKLFAKDGLLTSLFKEETAPEFWQNQSIGFDISSLNNELMLTMVLVILHKVESMLDGSPTIIVLDEAWKTTILFPNDILTDFLYRMSKANCVVIFTGSDIETILSSEFTTDLNNKISTQIFLPGNIMNKNSIKTFGITKQELFMINGLQSSNRHFFLKQHNSSIVLKLDMSDMVEEFVLSSQENNINNMIEAIKETKSNDPELWLPAFYDKAQKFGQKHTQHD